jgi:hypothetical protein
VLPFLVWEAGPKPKEAPRPKQWEWERLSSLVHDERWQIELVTGGRLIGADKWAAVEDIVHGRGVLLYLTPGSDGMDGMAQPWQLALDHALSPMRARAGVDGIASGCCGGLAWRQHAPNVVL